MTFIRHINEARVNGKRLGRHVRHDPRSLSYLYPADKVGDLVSVKHERHIPVLDQGDLGSCTGNAAEGCVGSAMFLSAVPDENRAKPTGNKIGDESQAVVLYSAATKLDDVRGYYPPTDTGSDGLSVAKAAKKAGLISGYQHCTSLDATLKALSQRPVICGVNWYEGMDEPDENGLVKIAGQVRGGHEFVLDELDVENKLIGATNSWGESFGVNGRFYISWDDFEKLLSEDGDVTVFVPISQPAPTPTPTPSDQFTEFTAMLKTFVTEVQSWLRKHGM